jgi:heme-degrading monooxygenase HmoA
LRGQPVAGLVSPAWTPQGAAVSELGGYAMAVVLFVVKASITPEQEEAFNRWYNEEHCPQLLQFRGAVSARRYKAILGEDEHQYMAVYEFESEATFQRFLKSGHLEELKREYDAHFAGVSERTRSAWVQVWP